MPTLNVDAVRAFGHTRPSSFERYFLFAGKLVVLYFLTRKVTVGWPWVCRVFQQRLWVLITHQIGSVDPP